MASSILKSSAAPHRARKSSIAWDESNLGDNDAYLASTTREKIIEPKTPYSEPLDMDAFDDAIETERTTRDSDGRLSHEQNGRLLPGEMADLSALTNEAVRRREPLDPSSPHESQGDEFAAKRSAHYDEFRRVKELREKGMLPEDEEDGKP